MSRLNTLKNKIKYRIKRSRENVFFVRDFYDLSGKDQIIRALRTLIAENLIIRVGKGIYSKAKKSIISGKIIPIENIRSIAISALKKLGINIKLTPAEQAYNNFLTTQVPNGLIIGVDKKISRIISFGNMVIKYEYVI